MRFGNKAFRTWLEKIISTVNEDLKGMYGKIEGFERGIDEIKEYLIDSFGSKERIDYGTGHELNFVMFMYCLYKMGIYEEKDFKSVVNVIFQKYLELMRKV